jgi:hypothetical protein
LQQKQEPFEVAKELLGLAAQAGSQRHQSRLEGDRDKARRAAHSKLALACQATLASPADVVWLEDLYFGGTVSISTTRKRGPRVHIPRKLLREHIRNNGFDPEQKTVLWSKFDFSKNHFVQSQDQIQKMRSRRRKRKKGPAKV